MRLFIVPGSPYSRLAQVVVLEKALGSVVEIVNARTRQANSPYYAINPSGRVPFLETDCGRRLEDSALISAWLDQHHGQPMFQLPAGDAGWETRRFEAMARSLLDGLSVWLRENRRPEAERSPTIVQHETDRAGRITDVWETEILHPWMTGPINLAQITLGCALGLEVRIPDYRWRTDHPNLCAWFDRIAARPSFVATAPAG